MIHLGMSGRFTVAPGDAEPEPHEQVVFRLADGRKLRFRDPRRFGVVFALPSTRLADDPHFVHLGVEPLEPGFDGAALRQAAAGRRGPVKAFLMDASVVVGGGNIYASEALFEAGIHPLRSVARISAPRWDLLAEAVRSVLSRAIDQGGTPLNDFADADGQRGYFQVSLAAYDREGQPCRRWGGPGGRSVLWKRRT